MFSYIKKCFARSHCHLPIKSPILTVSGSKLTGSKNSHDKFHRIKKDHHKSRRIKNCYYKSHLIKTRCRCVSIFTGSVTFRKFSPDRIIWKLKFHRVLYIWWFHLTTDFHLIFHPIKKILAHFHWINHRWDRVFYLPFNITNIIKKDWFLLKAIFDATSPTQFKQNCLNLNCYRYPLKCTFKPHTQ